MTVESEGFLGYERQILTLEARSHGDTKLVKNEVTGPLHNFVSLRAVRKFNLEKNPTRIAQEHLRASVVRKYVYGNSNRSSSPSSATADGRFTGNNPFQSFQLEGTRRVWVVAF